MSRHLLLLLPLNPCCSTSSSTCCCCFVRRWSVELAAQQHQAFYTGLCFFEAAVEHEFVNASCQLRQARHDCRRNCCASIGRCCSSSSCCWRAMLAINCHLLLLLLLLVW
jgi:hypothetical protein